MAGRFMLGIVVSVILTCGLLSCNLLVQDPVNPDDNEGIYTVTFDSQGGSTPNPAKKTVTLGSPYGTLPVVTRSGLCFGGWWTETESKGSHIYPSTIVTIAADHTLYAGWQNPWARTVSTGAGSSAFHGVAVDSFGNVYVAGYQEGTTAYTYGPGVSATGSSTSKNVVLVKYDSSGNALWAHSVSGSGLSNSEFHSVAVDSLGNVYVAGYQEGTTAYTYGPGVSATGSFTGTNVVLVKYDSSGTARWARSVNSGSDYSSFRSVALDYAGNIYAAGYQIGTGEYNYGTGVTATGSYTGYNAVLVKYDPNGSTGWAKTVSGSGLSNSAFYNIAVDSNGNVYTAGHQFGTGNYFYGPGVSASGTYNLANVVVVKYDSSGTASWARSVNIGPRESAFRSIWIDSSGTVYAAGYQNGTSTFTYGSGVTATGTNGGPNVLLVKYDSNGTPLNAWTVTEGSNNSVFNSVAVDSFGNIYTAGYQNGTGTYTYREGVSVSGSSSSNNAVLVKYGP